MIQEIGAKDEDDLEKISVFRLNFLLHFKNSGILNNNAISVFFQL